MALQTKERVHGRAVGWRRYDSRRGHWDFYFTYSRLPYYGPGAIQGLTTLPSSCADFPEILGASISWGPKDLSRFVMGELNKTFEALNQSPFIKYCYNKKNATYANNSRSVIYIQSGIK